jgi:arylsulfatase A-like enzyme
MKSLQKYILPGIGLTGAIFNVSCHSGTKLSREQNTLPNIIYILADDLGYGELGCYGQEKIETPNIDLLAKSGMIFTQHYTGAPVSAPARCVLLTGLHTGNAQIRGNDEWRQRGNVGSYVAMLADSTLEGQRPMKPGTQTIASILKNARYRTALIGKWGLGAPHTSSVPLQIGFDYFMGYNCQRQAHTFYPVHLYENSRRILLGNDTVQPHIKLGENQDAYSPESYKPFELQTYSCDFMHQAMEKFLDKNNPKNTGQPFFLYWATPIPHVPLQAPKRWVDYYVQKFGDEKPYKGESGYYPHRYPRAAYAAMISYLDEQVGQLIRKLKEMGVYDNTLIIFTSDNGSSFTGGVDYTYFNSNKPFNNGYGRSKGFLYEGGIRVPMIASWPGKIKPASVSDHVSAFWDVMPTFSAIAGLPKPEESDGISFLPTLLGKKQQEHKYLYWELHEYGGQQAVRMGKWKGIRKNIFEGNREIELYDLDNDPLEQKNLAVQFPEVVLKIQEMMKELHKPATIEKFNFKF